MMNFDRVLVAIDRVAGYSPNDSIGHVLVFLDIIFTGILYFCAQPLANALGSNL